MRDVDRLPVQAEATIKRIEALLAQAEPLLGDASDEPSFAIRETRRRYLPETVKAFLDIPPARRDPAAESMFVEQLALLERATAQRLGALSAHSERALAANGSFLTNRFGPLDSLPEPAFDFAVSGPLGPVREVLARMVADAGASGALLEAAATQLSTAFPAIVAVKHAPFEKNHVESVAVDVPRPDDTLRYLLVRDRFGAITIRERLVRGVRLKAEVVDVAEWTAALLADLAAYAQRGPAERREELS